MVISKDVGVQYYYEIEVKYSNGITRRSAPFVVLSFINNNLVLNGNLSTFCLCTYKTGGFEGDDDYAWDKWYSGAIPWDDMVGTSYSYQGQQAMHVTLKGETSCSSITQWNQYGIPDSTMHIVFL